jgi:hypothetical protein
MTNATIITLLSVAINLIAETVQVDKDSVRLIYPKSNTVSLDRKTVTKLEIKSLFNI